MITHICSHFGDIEIVADSDGHARISWDVLTPAEVKAVAGTRKVLRVFGKAKEVRDGVLVLPVRPGVVACTLGLFLRPSKDRIVAVRYATGKVGTTLAPVQPSLLTALPGGKETTTPPAAPPPDPVVQTIETARVSGAVAAVVVPVPHKGCPMPDFTQMREEKAASVLRKFLNPTQQQDFDRKRSFVARGGVTGHTYIVTSRWAPSVERLGVLHDLDTKNRVCSSNDGLPPSEECLSMKFIVEGPWEQTWLDAALNH